VGVKVADHARRRRWMTVTSDANRLAEVRAFIRKAVADFGGSTRASDDLVQAVDEATCNVMLHGYADKPGEIEIEAALRDRKIEIRILDRAPSFDPTVRPDAALTKPPQPTRAGGMGVGVHLLRTMVDEVHHSARSDGGNELTLVRSIEDGAQEDGAQED
jgi:stage II sporulation protein AB (anti-sigma F factor)